jgi:very-short-patch-repair endonuclease
MKPEPGNLKNSPRPSATPPVEGIEEKPTPAFGHPSTEGKVVGKSPPAEGCRNGGVGSSILKYNSNLTPFAKKLRAHMTLAEVLLWKKLNRRQLGVRFNRQKPIGKWVVDFYCKELRLAVEVDGASHNFREVDDEVRQQQLEALGIRFLRFWDCEVKNEIGSVIERIDAWIKANPPRSSATPPMEGNEDKNPPRPSATPPVEGNEDKNPPRSSATPPVEGIEEKPTPAFGHPSRRGDREKTVPSCGGVPERRGGSKRGSALVVVLWILMIIALIVSIFAFEMQLESKMITLQRARFKADQLALAGVELAKAMLLYKEDDETRDAVGQRIPNEDPWVNQALRITDALPVEYTEPLGDGEMTVKIDYEESRLNIKNMTTDQWHLLFQQAEIPVTRWDDMLDCLTDWQDENDAHHGNGAESDDPFYKNRGYECKNAPVDTVDELLLIKNWGEEVLYGTLPGEETDSPIFGIADQLTTWGSGKVNLNSTSEKVLNDLGISDDSSGTIQSIRLGPDGEPNTEDDGFPPEDLAGLGADAAFFTFKPEYVSVTSIGKVAGIQSRISCIFKLGEKEAVPLFWLEGKTSK